MSMIRRITQSLPIHFILLLAVSLLSYHEVFRMYFLGDDFGTVYKIQNNFSFSWPQHQLVNMLRPLYNMFHAEPFGYFASGFLVFVISAVLFYFLAKTIFQNNLYAFIAALIYTTAPIGVESVTMMILYIGSYYALALFSLILIFLLKFLKTGKTIYYIFCIGVLLLSFETVAYRAFLFPIVMLLFGMFFWNRKILGVKKLIISYAVIFFLWGLMYLFRAYLVDVQGSAYVTNLNPTIIMERLGMFMKNFKHYFLGNIYYERMDSAFIDAIYTNPINALGPLIGTLNIIYVIPLGKIIPSLHIALSILLIAFSTFVFKKRKRIKDSNLKKYFASIAFIFAVVLAFFIPFPKIIMPSINHYAVYALPGYALLITSVFLILVNLFAKQKFAVFKIIPYLLLVVVVSINLYNVRDYLSVYNQRIVYVRPFFKQLKELQPTLPPAPLLVYIETIVKPDDDPAEARWRLYDIWHGGIHGANVLFGLYYNIDAGKTIATPVWDTVRDFVRENPENIDRVYSFSYDLDGLQPTTEQVRERLRSLVATGEINL